MNLQPAQHDDTDTVPRTYPGALITGPEALAALPLGSRVQDEEGDTAVLTARGWTYSRGTHFSHARLLEVFGPVVLLPDGEPGNLAAAAWARITALAEWIRGQGTEAGLPEESRRAYIRAAGEALAAVDRALHETLR